MTRIVWLEYGLLAVFVLHALMPYFISPRLRVSFVAPLILVLFALALLEQYRSGKIVRLLSKEYVFLLLFLLVNAVSMVNSTNFPHSLEKYKTFLGGAILAYLVAQTNPYSFWKKLIDIMSFILLCASILGVIQFFAFWSFGFRGYPASIFLAKKHHLFYATGFATTHSEFGGHIIIFFPLIFALFLMANTPNADPCSSKRYKTVLFLSTSALVLTFSRSAYLGLAVALILFIALAPKRRSKAIKMSLVLSAIGMITFFIVKAIPRFPEMTDPSYKLSLNADPSALSRIDYLIMGWEMFKEHPLIGTGPNSFIDNFERVKTRVILRSAVQNVGAHNTFLSILVGSGVIGLLVFLVMIVCALRNFMMAFRHEASMSRKLLYAGLASSLIGFSIHMSFHDLFGEKFFWMLLGLGFRAKEVGSKEQEGDPCSDQ